MTKIEKNLYREVIIIFCRKNINHNQDKDKYYRDSVISVSMVRYLFAEFRCGRKYTSDTEWSGRPTQVAIPETNKKNHDILLANRRWTVRKIVETIRISHVSMFLILNDYLGLRMPFSKWLQQWLFFEYLENIDII